MKCRFEISTCFADQNLDITEDSTIEELEATEPKIENSRAELNSGTIGHENNSVSKDDSSWMNHFGTDWSLDDPASLSGRPPGNNPLFYLLNLTKLCIVNTKLLRRSYPQFYVTSTGFSWMARHKGKCKCC